MKEWNTSTFIAKWFMRNTGQTPTSPTYSIFWSTSSHVYENPTTGSLSKFCEQAWYDEEFHDGGAIVGDGDNFLIIVHKFVHAARAKGGANDVGCKHYCYSPIVASLAKFLCLPLQHHWHCWRPKRKTVN